VNNIVKSAAVGLVAFLAAGCDKDYELTTVDGEIVVSPALYDIGDVVVGEPQPFQIEVRWVNGSAVTVFSGKITGLDEAGGYFTFDESQIPTEGLVVDEGAPVVLEYVYTPTEVGYHRAQIEIVNNSKENQIYVDARGHATIGEASVRPQLLDFGAVAVGDSKTLEVTVDNEGGADLSVIGAAFSNPAFTLGGSPPFDLLVGSEVQVPIIFTPTDDQPATGTVDLDLGGFVTVTQIGVRGNDCENGTPSAYDVDGDGYTSCGGDCNDNDDDIHPGVVEEYDSADQDCDGTVDETTEGYDDDGDGQTELDGDCNDGDDGVNQTASEDYSNGVDDDCDGIVDYGTTDADADGYSEAGGDCDDLDGAVYPGAPELEDAIDNDCDGVDDEGTPAYDDDGDGETENAGDCDDTDASIYSTAAEAADWMDDDCDGTVDEGTTNFDDDADGFSELGGDCDDTKAAVNPGEPETSGNGVDDDCDGTTS
jgi:hypothetical protein